VTILTVAEARALAEAAGFVGSRAQTIVAIAQAESGLNTLAQNTTGNTPPSTDRGILQINSFWHAEVPNSCAYDAACSFERAYGISAGGRNFTPWAAYKQGTYEKYMGAVEVTPNVAALGTGIPDPFAAVNTAIADVSNALAGVKAVNAWVAKPERPTKLVLGVVLIGVGILGIAVASGAVSPHLPTGG
jgi:Lysozyme like domain